ncbi:MAG: four helix bundle protein [Acidobacteria bacterium]|nr:four helix bundle protein [Acidobacteriota bacterium]
MAGNLLQEKSYKFALRIVKLSEYLNNEKKEYVLSRKVLDSGTAIGVFIEEASQSPDHSDFILKYSLANKEAFKTNFWLRLLRNSEFIGKKLAASMIEDCQELKKLLISSLKTARSRE